MRARDFRSLTLERLASRHLLTAVPALNSLPDAEYVAFLDFDGHNVSGSSWNSRYSTIHSPPFDLDGDTGTFSDHEIERITQIWATMAEDFRPFNINVTTEDPSLANPDIFHESGLAQRVLFTSRYDSGPGGTGDQWFSSNSTAGTSALRSWWSESDNPVWVFSSHRAAGDVGSHELGHALGLFHDGELRDNGTENPYRGSHGFGETAWSPIMGFGRGLSQWSNGHYANASNKEDDVRLLTAHLGFRPDDYVSPGPLPIDGTSVDLEGVIHSSADTDVFLINATTTTTVSITADPWHENPNLDIGLALWGPYSFQFEADDPVVNPPDKLGASFEISLEPGTYYLIVDGVGKAPVPGDEGYPDYGSLGYYRLTGTVVSDDGLRGDVNADGELNSQDIDALFALMGRSAAAWPGDPAEFARADLDADAAVSQADADILIRDVLGTEYGDFDLNRKVDFADFLLLTANFGKTNVGWSQGDANADGEVDFSDFLALAAVFGFGTGDD